jgi:DNA-binding FadR family transcriptional regulator
VAESLTARVVDRLTAEIRDGDVSAGQRLPTEAELMQRFGVSRTVIREAVARLRAAGLVESQQGRGTFVLTRPSQLRFEFGDQAVRSVPEIIALVEFRIGIESEAASLAARRRSDHDLARIRKAGERSHDEPGAPTRSIQADFDFHHAIARASGNHYYPELLAALGPMMILTPKGRRIAGRTADPVHAEHLAILTAITNRDPQTAAAAMRLHLINSAERVRREA